MSPGLLLGRIFGGSAAGVDGVGVGAKAGVTGTAVMEAVGRTTEEVAENPGGRYSSGGTWADPGCCWTKVNAVDEVAASGC